MSLNGETWTYTRDGNDMDSSLVRLPQSIRLTQRPGGSHTRRGFSLVEALVSMAILAAVVTGFLSSMNAAFRGVRHQQEAVIAIGLVDALSEELLMVNPSSTELAMGVHQRFFDVSGRRQSTQSGATYTLEWSISPLETDSSIRTIEMRVLWSQQGTPRRIAWTTWRN